MMAIERGRARPRAEARNGAAAAVAVLVLTTACSADVACVGDAMAPGCAVADDLDVAPRPLLVFQSNRQVAAGEIYTANGDGSEVRRLTTNAGTDAEPRWSPDGRRIAFASVRAGVREIWMMNADGTGQQRLTQLAREASSPDWSPDGARIAFQARRADGNWDIYVMGADGSNVTRLTSANSQVRPRWSPDGRRLLVQWFEESASCHGAGVYVQVDCGGRIALLAADGSGVQRLPRVGLDDGWADWSPDGAAIVFASYRSPGPGMAARGQIMIMNADGARPRALTPAMVDEWNPVWSRATDRIFFVSAWDVYSMRRDGSDVRRVSATQALDFLVHSR
jgi:Tol biopolymer transport system component